MTQHVDPTLRTLSQQEIVQLQTQGNTADNWTAIRVAEGCDLTTIQRNRLCGAVHIGTMQANQTVQAEADGIDLSLPEGVYDSHLSDCTIGAHSAVHQVRLLRNYIIGDHCLLYNIGELVGRVAKVENDNDTCAPFHSVSPMNECGGRTIHPVVGMTIGMAYLWARYRGRPQLMAQMEAMSRPLAGQVNHLGAGTHLRNCVSVRNVDTTSTMQDPVCIDSCLMLNDVVAAGGCHIGVGVMAEHVMLGEHVSLGEGLRINDCVVGDNSTLCRCEVGCSFIFPAHEQHHNNSFLIAALIQGQSNLAAGATVGSNHNSRMADGELAAGRGFWPGLCTSLKHSSRFASYCLLSKADYPYELNIRYPFALINNNTSRNHLEVMPADWWMYNMYALDRCSRKFAERDKRISKQQHVEFAPLAPYTAEEILEALLDLQQLLHNSTSDTITAAGMENSKRPTVVLKADHAIKAYTQMLLYYILQHIDANDALSLPNEPRETQWENVGGQIVATHDVEHLLSDIENQRLLSWQEVGRRLDALWQDYPTQRARHARAILKELRAKHLLQANTTEQLQAEFSKVQEYVAQQIALTRQKDEDNPFRKSTYLSEDERKAVLG